MKTNKQTPLVKIVADTVDRKTGVYIFAAIMAFLLVSFSAAGSVIPPVFRKLKANSDCVYNGHNMDKLTFYCDNFPVNTQPTWEAQVANMNATNTFFSVSGQITRTRLQIENGLVIRNVYGAILRDQSRSCHSRF
jgi:hypothetical protein